MKTFTLNDLRFSQQNIEISSEAMNLIEISKESKPIFTIIFNFFITHNNNNNLLDDIEEELDFEKEDYESLYEEKISDNEFNKLKGIVKKLYSTEFPYLKYKKVVSSFQESLVREWKENTNPNFEVLEEPKIFHKRSILFKRKKYRRSLCDVVCIDRQSKIFEAFECKYTIGNFHKTLMNKSNYKSKKKRKNREQAKRKQDYLCSLKVLLKDKFDFVNVNVEYVTYFDEKDFPATIGIIPVLSLQKLSYSDIFRSRVSLL